ncbi:MAG: aminoacyl-tRNA hydrolase [Epulopiscium sp. Nuni2H_MBin003]|nr:MAG: aminoacyl-tRNA hydrolase [Epulopiscium sp. Nuni2H_MBin003]
MKLIVGLGNPGAKYLGTRHNVGFDAIDYVAHHLNVQLSKNKFKSIIGEGNVAGQKVVFMKPLTFMNLSGEAVSACVNWYKLDLTDILIIYDDTAFDAGVIKIRKSGSAGGHNGIKNIIEHLGTTSFGRVRIGVGQKPPNFVLADYVLAKFEDEQFLAVKEQMPMLKEAIQMFITKDLDIVMNRYNVSR